MAYVKRNSTNSLKNSIDYILDNSKTDDLLVYENQLATMNTDEIVEQMNRTKEYFNKENGIQGHHFIQSFSPDEEIDLELAHQVGIEWSQKFIKDYEFVLATHKDKDHIHNHIIINSVNVKDGKKYLSNIAEREYIRDLSDEVCKKYDLSIIQRKGKPEKNLSYAEWKYQKQGISWKDKIRNDINEAINKSTNYEDFILAMKDKNYTMRYGDNYKYNSFKHEEMKRSIRGRTLGYDYTEEKIKERIGINQKLLEHSKNKTKINVQKRVVFSKRYVNNKFKYIKAPQIQSSLDKEKIEEKRQAIQENRVVEFLNEHELTDINKYVLYKEEISKTINQSIKALDKKVANHNELLVNYNNNKTSENRSIVLESKFEVEKFHESIVELQETQKQFKQIDKYLLKQQEEKEKEEKERERENGDFIR